MAEGVHAPTTPDVTIIESGERSPLADRLLSALDSSDLHRSVTEMAEASLPDDELGRAAVVATGVRELETVRGLVLDLGEPEQQPDLFTMLQSWYISIRARWQVINARLQAQMTVDGTADMVLLTEGSLLTALVVLFESECKPQEIDQISNLLADISTAAVTVDQVRRGKLVEARPGTLQLDPESLLDALALPVDTILRARQLADESIRELGATGDIAEVRDRLQRCTAALDEGVQSLQRELLTVTRLPWSSAIDGLEQYGRETLKDRAYRARVVVGPAPGGLPGEGWVALTTTAQHILDQIAEHAFEPREERVASGKPAFLTVRLGVEARGEDDLLLIEDDGSLLESRPALGELPATVRTRLTDKGCIYEVVVPRRALPKADQFVIARIDGHRLAFPASAVSAVFGQARVTGGHVLWEGQVAPFMDGAACLDGELAEPGARRANIMLRIGDENGEPGDVHGIIALGIDAVESVVTAHPLPVPLLIGRQTRFLRGLISDREERMTLVVDPTTLIAAIA